MTKPATCNKRRRMRRQRGDALFEALIGIVLMMILGLGLSYAAARTLHFQRYASTQGIALNQMRGALETTGVQALCAGGATVLTITPSGSTPQTISVEAPTCQRDTVSVGVESDASLAVTLASGSATVVTRMSFATPTNDDTARSLLGDGETVLSQ